jgi:DNA gyrase subunit A
MSDNKDNQNENNENNKIQLVDIRNVIEQKYLNYAMSVIVDRALPDIRDGLKPVHRRILHSMNELGNEYDKSYKKSARIVGDVIGKYHPHGDSSVYEAKVRMAQAFSMRVLLVDGQGNFGSIDGDSAAAMRYTEVRMHKIGQSMFSDISLDTVDFRPNYDGNEHEPTVLPLRFPNLLINGVQGIAVAMASNIPPHNPIEALECVKKMVEDKLNNQPHVLEDLMRIMPAPDFPTGGIIHGAKEMTSAWTHGRAKMKLRATWFEEEVNGRTAIIINQIPYQVNKAKLYKKMVELSEPNNDKNSPFFGKCKIEGVYEAIDESDKDGIRIAIYLKPEADAEIVFNQFLRETDLEVSINYNSTVLINDKPRVVGILEILEKFIEHRMEVIVRRTKFLLKKAAARLHTLEGLMKAVDPANLDKVINLIKASTNTQEAKTALINFLCIEEDQAAAILDLKLQKLTGMQLDEMKIECEKFKLSVEDYNDLLSNETRRYNVIIEESDEQITNFAAIKEKESFYGVTHPYRQRLSDVKLEIIKNDLAALTKEESCTIMYSANGYISRVSLEEFESQNRGTRGKKKMKLKKEDCIKNSINCHSHNSLMFISNKGKTYSIMAYDIPSGEKGRHINNLLDNLDDGEQIIQMLPVDFEQKESSLLMITKKGKVKRTEVSEYLSSKRKGGVIGINLQENDDIVYAGICTDTDQIILLNNSNKSIRFQVSAIRKLSRNSLGVTGMDLTEEEHIIGGAIVNEDNGYMICVSENGLIKITEINQYRIQKRGGKGLRAMKSNERSGNLFSALFTNDLNVDLLTTTKNGLNNRISLSNINVTSRNTTGVSLVKLEKDDELVSIFIVEHEDFENIDDILEEEEEVNNESVDD